MTIKIIILAGDHPRNIYIVNKISSLFKVQGIILEKRSTMLPKPKKKWTSKEKKIFIKHFVLRAKEEKKFFENDKLNLNRNIKLLRIKKNLINSKAVRQFIKKNKPNLLITCGISFLKDPILKLIPKYSINIHTGLTPRYKGDACNFWPMFFLEPNNIGVTFHLISKEVDSGAIVHQVKAPKISKDDNCHSLSCKSLIKATSDLIKIIRYYKKFMNIKTVNKKLGRVFFKTDFRIEHLMSVYNNNIIDMYLKKKIQPKKIKLVNFFKNNK